MLVLDSSAAVATGQNKANHNKQQPQQQQVEQKQPQLDIKHNVGGNNYLEILHCNQWHDRKGHYNDATIDDASLTIWSVEW